MSLFSRLFSTKSNTISRVEWNNLFEWLGYRTSTGKDMDEKTSLEVQAVLCAVRVIAEGLAQMPGRVRKFEVKNNRTFRPEVKDHWAVDLMTVRPNAWMTPYQFVEYAVFIAALFGDFVAYKNMAKDGTTIKELLPLVPGSWSIRQNEKYQLEYVIKDRSGGTIEKAKPSQVMHLRGPSLNGFSAIEPVKLAREAVGLSQALETHQSKMASNGGRPSGILSTENRLKQPNIDEIKKSWQEKFGSGGDGGLAVLDGGWSFTPMTMSSVDQQHIESRKFQIEEIARAFRVFPQMLMQSDKTSTFASAEQFFNAHVIHTLGPWVRRFEEVVNRDVLGHRKNMFYDLDERSLLRGNFKDEADYYAKSLGAGGTPAWMTQNEVREVIGLEPHESEEADMLFNGFQDNTQDAAPDDTPPVDDTDGNTE